ncbi:hypothetical protein EKI60_01545 [Candidatus Saccharibacteria bacterium]|nr:MAG: hypothetical protein EKI60_01545 [Candidatus Saccharibacteria bacterium]
MANNWYVITGGTSSGKSTIIAELKKLGHTVFDESARVIIDAGLAAGKTVEQVRADERAFQEAVLQKKIDIEQAHDQSLLTFFDRGMHDTEAYFKHYGWELSEAVKEASRGSTYNKVFLLDQLPNFEKDYARTEGEGFSDTISKLLHEAYEANGMKPIRVPVLPIPERVKFILDNL